MTTCMIIAMGYAARANKEEAKKLREVVSQTARRLDPWAAFFHERLLYVEFRHGVLSGKFQGWCIVHRYGYVPVDDDGAPVPYAVDLEIYDTRTIHEARQFYDASVAYKAGDPPYMLSLRSDTVIEVVGQGYKVTVRAPGGCDETVRVMIAYPKADGDAYSGLDFPPEAPLPSLAAE